MGFKKPRKHKKLGLGLEESNRRKGLFLFVVVMILLTALAVFINKLRQEKVPDTADQEVLEKKAVVVTPLPFVSEQAFEEAKTIFEKARAHEYRGNKQEVRQNYARALELFERIKDRDPEFRAREVQGRISFCRRKLRKSW